MGWGPCAEPFFVSQACLRNQAGDGGPPLHAWLFQRVPTLQKGGFLMAPIVGSRQPMAWSVLGGLAEALAGLPERSPALEAQREWLVERIAALKGGVTMAPPEVAAAVARAEAPALLGLMIVYDELGKSLEYATLNAEDSDVGLLQILAETASRSHEAPIALITILHQGFEQFASHLGPAQRQEWRVVQGRFEDVGFQQSGGELLSLMDRAIARDGVDDALQGLIQEEAERAAALELLPRELAPEGAVALWPPAALLCCAIATRTRTPAGSHG